MLLLALIVPLVHAEIPLPTYPDCGEQDRPDLCPPDLGEEWWMISYIPEHARDSVRTEELSLGSGMHADRAWRTTTGRWDVVLATVDSGVKWEDTDLVNKIHLNTGELPLPQDADGVAADDYDFNGDSIVNVQDYAEDPRVDITAGRSEADSVLDPSDLIYTFSDGVDDDGNGYPDDIAGWDFFGRDNDPGHDYREHFGDHGSGVLETMGAEGGDSGDIGVCPNCSLLPVRVGDTFVSDGTRAAEAISFAVDSGAVGITNAIGALTDPEATRAAVRYAFDQGTVIIGAAGDENSYHHNFPAVLDNIVYTHSIRYNTGGSGDDVYSYMNTLNCNNFSMRMVAVAPQGACATGAVAAITGMVGLIQSAGRDAGIDLTAGEVYQLIAQTADDVWLSEDELAISQAYPSHEGWEPFFGYGRVNAEAAVQAVASGDIPPWVTLDSPEWFEVRDADSSVEVRGTLSAERSASFTYTVEVGTGFDPLEWTQVDQGSGEGQLDGLITTIDLSDLPVQGVDEATQDESIVGRLERVNGPAVTVRVRVTDAEGHLGELRKTFFAQRDPDLLPGFPMSLGASGESSPILADLDDDGVFEVVVATSDGNVMALDGSGEALPGWPVRTDALDDAHLDAEAYTSGAVPTPHDGIMATVAVGDLDGDGSPEVVAAAGMGGLWAWHADGTLVDGFPHQTIGRSNDEYDDDHSYDQGYSGAPTLYDLDGDGVLEIIAASLDGRLYVVGADGTDWGPYPVEICYPDECDTQGRRIFDSVTVGDVDGDGAIELSFGTNEAVHDGSDSVTYLMDALSGTHEAGWPMADQGLVAEAVLLPILGEGHPASTALADLDGDGGLEIFNPVMLGTTDVVHADGSVAVEVGYYGDDYTESSNVDASLAPMIVQMTTNPGIGDLDGDGVPDLVLGGASSIYLASLAMNFNKDYQQAVGAWSGVDGHMLEGWPRQIEDLQFLMAPAIADVSGDDQPEVIYGSAGYLLHAWDGAGVEAEGWPKFTGNWLLGSPAVGDITGDGYLDVVVTTREGWLYAWSTAGHADQDVQWASVFHDAQNTGNYEQPLPTQAGPDEAEAELRGCCKGKHSSDTAWIVMPIWLLALRRRRR